MPQACALGGGFSSGHRWGILGGHRGWISFALVAIYQPKLFEYWFLLDYFLTALVIAWLAGIQWVLMCLLMEKAEK